MQEVGAARTPSRGSLDGAVAVHVGAVLVGEPVHTVALQHSQNIPRSAVRELGVPAGQAGSLQSAA